MTQQENNICKYGTNFFDSGAFDPIQIVQNHVDSIFASLIREMLTATSFRIQYQQTNPKILIKHRGISPSLRNYSTLYESSDVVEPSVESSASGFETSIS